MRATPGSVVAGVISREIGGTGELLRRVRENNRIVSELRVVESGKAEMRIAADSEAIDPGDAIAIASEQTGAGTKATTAGFIAGRALEAWEPGDTKTISVMLDASWYVPPIEEIAHEHDEESGYDDHFFSNIFARIIAWLAEAENGIENLFAKNLYAENVEAHRILSDELCARDDTGTPVCITGNQLSALLGQTANAATAFSMSSSPSEIREPQPPISVSSTSTPETTPTTPEQPTAQAGSDSQTDERSVDLTPDAPNANDAAPTDIAEPANDNPAPPTEATGS